MQRRVLIRLTISSTANFEKFFEESFAQLFGGLHRYAFTLLKDNEMAHDAVQSVFVKWWETQKRIDYNSIKPYLYTAVYRQCLNVIRNEKTKSLRYESYKYDHAASLIMSDDATALKELDDQIRETIDQLPPQCKVIFEKSRFEDKRYGEIADEMNLSVKTVEAQMGKALRILRERLKEYL